MQLHGATVDRQCADITVLSGSTALPTQIEHESNNTALLRTLMGASQTHPRETTAAPLLPVPTHLPPLSHHVNATVAAVTALSPPPLPTHIAAYLDWLFSLPPSSASQFACYLLHLTQGIILPPIPPPFVVDLIASPPFDCFPSNVQPHTTARNPPPANIVYRTLSTDETSAALLVGVLSSRGRVVVCAGMMCDGPLLAACRIAQSLLTILTLPPPTHTHLSPTTTSSSPLHLLRSHQLCRLLRPLLSRVDWSLSSAALSDEQSTEAAYYLCEVTVVQLRRLRSDVLRLCELMSEDAGWVRQQRRAVLLGVWRGQCGVSSGSGGSLGVLAADRLFDVQLLREMFSYVWE